MNVIISCHRSQNSGGPVTHKFAENISSITTNRQISPQPEATLLPIPMAAPRACCIYSIYTDFIYSIAPYKKPLTNDEVPSALWNPSTTTSLDRIFRRAVSPFKSHRVISPTSLAVADTRSDLAQRPRILSLSPPRYPLTSKCRHGVYQISPSSGLNVTRSMQALKSEEDVSPWASGASSSAIRLSPRLVTVAIRVSHTSRLIVKTPNLGPIAWTRAEEIRPISEIEDKFTAGKTCLLPGQQAPQVKFCNGIKV
ncbi:Uncharacterized protein HZ326_12835 [Fusarium oxysporum f. sp. albedinis]|nr:Uncharacterized protein HZ326_12835 [Fusarium oxysporum f. sp. albedinis]